MKKLNIIFFIALTAVFAGCKKDYINTQVEVANGAILHDDEIDIPNIWNPIRIKSGYWSDVDGAWRYIEVTNNGVEFDVPSSDLNKDFKNDYKACEMRTYMWNYGMQYVPVKILNFQNIYKFMKVDSVTGKTYGDTIDYTQLPQPIH